MTFPTPAERSKVWHGRGQSSEFARRGTTDAIAEDRREIIEKALFEAFESAVHVCQKHRCHINIDAWPCVDHLKAELAKILGVEL